MNTWSFKGGVAALSLTVLAACEDGQGVSLLQGIGAVPKAQALSQANMAFGAVTLVAPRGFCIDGSSLRQNFALMARCDTLGAPSAAADAPIGIITASFSTSPDSMPTPLDTAAALALDGVTDIVQTDTGITFRAKGPPPAEGFSNDHWRATALVGTQIMGLALFGPSGGQATGSRGRALLDGVIAASTAGS